MLVSSPSLNFSGSKSRISQIVAMPTFVWHPCLQQLHLYLTQISLSEFWLSVSLLYFHVLDSFLYWLFFFLKRHLGFSLGYKEAIQLHALLSVHVPNTRCTVISHQQTERSNADDKTSCCASVIYMMTEELAANLVFTAIVQSQSIKWNLNLVGRLMLFD